ncbi:MAG: hypothetical protein CL831_01790 [Crocinitomicaceae bacterium]|nr:hypothetical protein [Crocinitomicaceae bacterium]|tara:strand:+ start:1033 stop:1533 length:501 start_codon:yes stop_codon:yes gene_type:complete
MIRILILLLFIASSSHDIHFSKSSVDYNENSKTLQAVINVFTDDLELAIERSHDKLDLEIGSETQHASTDSLVADYCIHQVVFKMNTQEVDFEFIGFEYDYDICYLYLESDTLTMTKFDDILLSVNLFFDVYEDQENVVDLSTPFSDDNFILNRESPVATMKLNDK